MTHIAVFVGSRRKDSINQHYADQLEKLLPEGTTFTFADLDLPMYSQDLEEDFPASVTAVKELVQSADGVLFVTPEHNRSFTALLKNAIDWSSRPWGQSSFEGKPVAIAGVSFGALGTTQAQQQLRNVLVYLNTKLLGQPEMYINASQVYNEAGELTDDARAYAQQFIETFVAHINASK